MLFIKKGKLFTLESDGFYTYNNLTAEASLAGADINALREIKKNALKLLCSLSAALLKNAVFTRNNITN